MLVVTGTKDIHSAAQPQSWVHKKGYHNSNFPTSWKLMQSSYVEGTALEEIQDPAPKDFSPLSLTYYK